MRSCLYRFALDWNEFDINHLKIILLSHYFCFLLHFYVLARGLGQLDKFVNSHKPDCSVSRVQYCVFTHQLSCSVHLVQNVISAYLLFPFSRLSTMNCQMIQRLLCIALVVRDEQENKAVLF